MLISLGMTLGMLGFPNSVLAKHVVAVPTVPPTPAPIEDPAITKIARQQFISWQAGAINRKAYTADMNALITQEKLSETSVELGQLGAYVSSEYVDEEPPALGIPPGSKTYLYRMHGTVNAVYMLVSVTPKGQVASLAFRDSIYDIHPTPSPSPTPPPTPEPTDTPDSGFPGY